MTRADIVGLSVSALLLGGAVGALFYAFWGRNAPATAVQAPRVTADVVERTLSYGMEVA